jgi:hypothetical protein
MWRWFVGGAAVFFGCGALAGLFLVGSLLLDREWRQAGGVGCGTVLFTWMTAAFRRDWQRAQQRREQERATSPRDD